MRCQTNSVAKSEKSDDENEDVSAADIERGRFALADGAAESAFAARWASLLAQAYVNQPVAAPPEWAAWLPPLQRLWLDGVGAKPLPYWAKSKVQRVGGYSTLLGVVVKKGRSHGKKRGPRPWLAVSVGDSCVFHLRGSSLLASFPLTTSREFNSHPLLVGTYTNPEEVGRKKARIARSTWHPGDTLILATDALSEWFLRRHEAGEPPWQELLRDACGPHQASDFADWVNALRARGDLKDDDTTATVIRL